MATNATFKSFEKELVRLVGIFERNLVQLKSPGYDEQSLRQEFLDPFFAALGWDMENEAGLIPSHREVIVERRTKDGRADYLFQPGRKPRFVCEAKKPAEELHGGYAMQAKGYAWTIGVRLAMLSDFEELKLYLVTGNPKKGEPDDGLWRSYHFSEYAAKAQELWDLLARDQVAGGGIERTLAALPKKLRPARTKNFDEEFLGFLDNQRQTLGSDLLRNNDRADLLEGTKLNEAVQCILDRLLFIRISEARGIDMGTKLHSFLEIWQKKNESSKALPPMREEPIAGWGGTGLSATRGTLWNAIVRQIRGLDRRPQSEVPYFNGNIFKFHFSEELVVGDVWLSEFLKDISEDESAYKFGYVAVEILGTIYERFLGKIVRPQGRGTTIEEKPEVRKAGGVYYTPRYIVEYIVEQTVGKLVAGKKPEETLKLRLLDPACGSGSFLLRVFERVCEHWQQWLVDHPDQRKKQWCWLDAKTNTLHLTLRAKRQILQTTVHGVDLDPQAVEVTQLSLYLKLLEGETTETLHREQDLFGGDEPILPPLQDNIKCGNSLIASDFSVIPDDLVRVHAFDWPVQFESIIKKAGGFDAVVGNPPYVMLDDGDEKNYMQEKYESDEGKPDLYKYFVEKSHRLMNKSGRFGMIMPASILKTPAYKLSRKFVLENSSPETVAVFNGPVFDDASVNCLILITVKQSGRPALSWVFDGSMKPGQESLTTANTEAKTISLDVWRKAKDNTFSPPETAAAGWISKILQNSVSLSSLGEYTLGMQVYHNSLHSQKEMKERTYHSETNRGKGWYRESGGSNIKRYEFISEFKEWVKYGESWCYNCPAERFISGARILVREITGETLVCTYSEETHIPNKAIIIFRSDKASLKFILGFLNSKLMGKFVSETTEKGTQRLFPRISLTSLKSLPIPKIDLKKPADKTRHDKLVGLVDKMLLLMPKLRAATAASAKATLQNAVTATDQQIDALVYELYGLTKTEIKIIESHS